MRFWTGAAVAVAAVFVHGASGLPAGAITTIAGNGQHGFSGDGGSATAARLYYPSGVAVDGKGNVYVADLINNRVRKVTPAGKITTFAGTGSQEFSGDGGAATSAGLSAWGVAVDGEGAVYIADASNNRIRKVSTRGVISTVAGNGREGFAGDGGPARSAQLFGAQAVAVDRGRNVYIADLGNERIRKVTTDGMIRTVAGNGQEGSAGDGGSATSAQLQLPQGVAVDGQGSIYIADSVNARVRKVDPSGAITTFAGTGVTGFSGDGGAATAAELDDPIGIAVDGQGNVYVADAYNNRLREISAAGTITTVAGTGGTGFSGDGGMATAAQLNVPQGLAVDGKGNVFIADFGNHRVRELVRTASTATPTVLEFYSPSGNLGCEMADHDVRGAYVYCQSWKTPHSVRMGLDGRLKTCRGQRCLGNPGENTPHLGYGKQITVGRFRCFSLRAGVKCVVIRSGKGFLIDKAGVRRIG